MTPGKHEAPGGPAADAQALASGLEAAVDELRRAGRILITTHINPDGDAIGSSLGLMHLLRAAGKDAVVASHDGYGGRYGFLPGAEEIVRFPAGSFDLGVAVDCGNVDRVGSVKDSLLACGRVMRIDHHAVGDPFGDVEYLDTSAAAVGEMIAALAPGLEVRISREAGQCLLASIVEDTRCFQFESVSPRTLRICAELVDAGADLHDVIQNLFWRNSAGAVRMVGRCLEDFRLEFGGKLAWAMASLEDFRRYQAIAEDMDDVAHELLSIEGVEVALLLREAEADHRVSLRSRNFVDVAAIAREFGGGGHLRAAGCRISKSPEALRSLLDSIGSRLNNS
ncbi:MAG: bifunctional oligoribonuclease/PAP phosphatase NrnA [Armatimonadota bacterium]